MRLLRLKRGIAALVRTLRNRFFWLVLASFIFVVAMTRFPSIPLGTGDRDDPRNDDEPVGHFSPFASGFIAACALGGFGVFDYKRRHPKWRGDIKMPLWDYESGQLMMSNICAAEESKWPWVACMRNISSGRMHTLELEANTRGNDLDYGEDIHILPCKLEEENQLEGHDFSRSCCCVPVIMEQLRGRTLVIHIEKEHRKLIGQV